MSPERPSGSRLLPILVLLLIVPVALGAGWLVGLLPGVQPPPPPPTRAPAPGPLAAPRPAGVRAEVRVEGARPAHREPEEAPKPDEVRGEYSSWTTIESAVTESQRNGKPILIDFNAEWCGPCRRMKQRLFDDGSYSQVVQTTVIPVSIVDRVREEGQNPSGTEDLQRRFDVHAFPTLVIFSPANGKAIKTEGFGDPEATLAWIKGAAQAVR